MEVRVRHEGQADQTGVCDGHRDGGEGGGGRLQGDDDDGGDILLNTSDSNSKVRLTLVRRKYRLGNGVRRDGLLLPTLFNYSTNQQSLVRGVGLKNVSFTKRGVKGVNRNFEK